MTTFIQSLFPASEGAVQKAINDSIPILSNIASTVSEMQGKSGSEIFSDLMSSLVSFGLKVIAAFAIYLVGAWLIRRVKKLLVKMFERKHTEASLAGFLTNLVNITMIILLIVVVIGVLGINTTSFAAILASGGLAIGMAMSGTLQNFAGGIMLLTFKPFKVGDYIESAGYEGTVQSITITATKITTVDNKEIIIPNGSLSNNSIKNFSSQSSRRVDWSISISYGDSFDDAKKGILEILSADGRIEKNPDVFLSNMGASEVTVSVRAWVKAADYWPVFFQYNELFYKELPKYGVHFPYPHLTVEMKDCPCPENHN